MIGLVNLWELGRSPCEEVMEVDGDTHEWDIFERTLLPSHVYLGHPYHDCAFIYLQISAHSQ